MEWEKIKKNLPVGADLRDEELQGSIGLLLDWTILALADWISSLSIS